MKRSCIFVAFLVAMMLTLVITVAALAAPAHQSEAPADDDVSGVYVSNIYPAADASGMVTMLALYPNNNAASISFYLGKDAPVVEVGTWELTEYDDVAVTLTGTPQQAYDTPATTTYACDGDALVDGGFVLVKLEQVTPEEMDAGTVPAVREGEPSSEDPTGVYVSDVYPAADASGMVELLALYGNNNAQMISFYLGKDEPIVENGTWQMTDDGAVEVTMTGTAEKEYDTPSVTTYTRVADALVAGAFALNKLAAITPAEMEARAAQDSNPSGSYASNVYPAADAPGMITVLTLYDNNNAEQTTIYLTKDAIVEDGTWELGANHELTVTMSGVRGETSYSEPGSTVYHWHGSTLVDGAFELNKLVTITPEEMNALTAPDVTAVYQSDVLIAADSPGRIITMTLYSDNTLTFDTDFMNDEPVIAEVGTWEKDADGNLTVSITGSADTAYDQPDTITFEQQSDEIVAVKYNKDMWGTAGLTLTEQPLE